MIVYFQSHDTLSSLYLILLYGDIPFMASPIYLILTIGYEKVIELISFSIQLLNNITDSRNHLVPLNGIRDG